MRGIEQMILAGEDVRIILPKRSAGRLAEIGNPLPVSGQLVIHLRKQQRFRGADSRDDKVSTFGVLDRSQMNCSVKRQTEPEVELTGQITISMEAEVSVLAGP